MTRYLRLRRRSYQQRDPEPVFIGICAIVVLILLIFAGCMIEREHDRCDANGGDWVWHPGYKYGHYSCENERPTLGAR